MAIPRRATRVKYPAEQQRLDIIGARIVALHALVVEGSSGDRRRDEERGDVPSEVRRGPSRETFSS